MICNYKTFNTGVVLLSIPATLLWFFAFNSGSAPVAMAACLMSLPLLLLQVRRAHEIDSEGIQQKIGYIWKRKLLWRDLSKVDVVVSSGAKSYQFSFSNGRCDIAPYNYNNGEQMLRAIEKLLGRSL